MPIRILLALCILLLHPACRESAGPADGPFTVAPSVFDAASAIPPRPERKPKELVTPWGEKRTDEYYWLNERDNPAVRAYLEAENRYADTVLAPVKALRGKLYTELKGRIQEEDSSVPYFHNGYWYISRYGEGNSYPVHTRRKGTMDGAEELLVDENALAEGRDYCQFGGFEVSPDNRLMAWSVDYTGRNLFHVHIRDLSTGVDLPDSFAIGSAFAWANDSRTLLYDTKDPVTLRIDRIWRHRIGTPPSSDVEMYREEDETQYAYLRKSKSGRYFFVNSAYSYTVEVHYLNADLPTGKFRSIQPREEGVYYDAEHHGDRFILRTNWQAPNFRLMQTPLDATGRAEWKDIVPHDPEVLIEEFSVFRDHLVLAERRGGLQRLRVMPWNDAAGAHEIAIDEPSYTCRIAENPEFDTRTFRYTYSSLRTPPTVVDYAMDTRVGEVRKVETVLGGFDPARYRTEFLWVTARDSTQVPVSLVYRDGFTPNGKAPCLLTGYGSYGYSYDPGFDRDILSLLDRGFVVAIAHIRGGMEMGYSWYEQGRMMRKMNTFHDFIDCADDLIARGYTASDRLFAEGRSAGGLLMGAVTNLRPELFQGIICGVPFVDVLTTMSDPGIPLTTGEYTEWGNPAQREEYDYMKRYSPYDNLKQGPYPNLLVLASFSDSQVQYFEPAKYVARLRDRKTDSRPLLFITSMSGSHGGASGRFGPLEERALEYAWMLGLLGVKG